MSLSKEFKEVEEIFQRIHQIDVAAKADLNEGILDSKITTFLQNRLSYPKLTISIVGLVKSGKSSFMDGVILDGVDLCPRNFVPETLGITSIEDSNGDSEPVLFIDGGSVGSIGDALAIGVDDIREYIHRTNNEGRTSCSGRPESFSKFVIRTSLNWLNGVQIPMKVIDSPGANEAAIPTLKSQIETILSESDVLVYVLDVSQLGSNDEERLLLSILNTAPHVLRAIAERGFFIINKIDKARNEGEPDDKFINYVINFLERIVIDGQPMRIPKKRIIPVSAEHYFLARLYQRLGHVNNMPENEKCLLLQTLFSYSAEDVLDNPDAYTAKINRGVAKILENSNGDYVRESILQFLKANSISTYLVSMLEKMKDSLVRSLGNLLRRQATSQLSHDQLTNKLSEIQGVLKEIVSSGKLRLLFSIIERTNENLVKMESQWYDSLKDPFTIGGAMDVLQLTSVKYRTQASASASAKDAAQRYCSSWLVAFLNSKNNFESRLSQSITSTNTKLVEVFRSLVDKIVKAFINGIPKNSLFDVNAFSFALQKKMNIKSLIDTAARIDVDSVDNAVASKVNTIGYSEKESYKGTESYQSVNYITRYHERRGNCGNVSRWTTSEAVPVTLSRQVTKWRSVNKTREETVYIVTADTIKAIVSAKCRSIVDQTHLDITRNITKVIQKMYEDLADNVSSKVEGFMNDLKRDRARNKQGEEAKRKEIQHLANNITETTRIIAAIDALTSLINSNKNELNLKHNYSKDSRGYYDHFMGDLLKRIGTQRLDSGKPLFQAPLKELKKSSTNSFLGKTDYFTELFQKDSVIFNAEAVLEILSYFESLPTVHISIAGLMKAGKTTLVNAMLQSPIAASGVLPETARVLHIQDCEGPWECSLPTELQFCNSKTCQKTLISSTSESICSFLKESNRKNRDSSARKKDLCAFCQFTPAQLNEFSSKPLTLVHQIPSLPMLLRSAPLQFTDTPGFNEAMLKHLVQDEMNQAIENSAAIIYVMNATRLEQEDESELIGHLHSWLHRSLEKFSPLNAKPVTMDVVQRVIPAFKKVFNLPNEYFHRTSTLPLIVVVNKLDEWKARHSGASKDILHARAYDWMIQQIQDVFRISHPKISKDEVQRIFPSSQMVLISANQSLVKSVVTSQILLYSRHQENLISGRTLANVTSTIYGVMMSNADNTKSLEETEQELLRICRDLEEKSCMKEFEHALKWLIMDSIVPNVTKIPSDRYGNSTLNKPTNTE